MHHKRRKRACIMEWLRGVLSAKPSSRGGFGYFTPEFSTVKDEWKRPVFNTQTPRVDGKRDDIRPAELAAGWMPSSRFARVWLSLEQRQTPEDLEALIYRPDRRRQ